ncbi:hypothetical protein SAMN02949497_3320 [Methylomagnum ishizawai]|uniref:Uncharacterized protein n=1 Tax=Methylomagnum ishizawai TaxID=1760988 RepID=A0A1Y6D5X0_9GAMM|nr:hypothetical protein [Methylomagnum ishizawai]SMF95942.1 hypothetical protein SAMN02949497_3320 [Methylomagnum ishizawai]
MKILAAVMALFAVIYFLPAFTSRTYELSGGDRAAIYRSAVKVKRTLPTDQRVLFDTSMLLLDKIKSGEGPDAFADAVGGKTPEEVIEMAKHEVNVKIAAGDPEFKQYASWEDMVAKLTDDGHKKTPAKPSEPEDAPLRNYSREGRPE